MSVAEDTHRDRLEAKCRQAIAKAARLPRRGFDSEREYLAAVAECDELLDQYNEG